MVVTFLGTGTSHGIPVLTCHCPVCESSDFRDKRYRSSILLEKNNKRIVIDTGYEFRLQLLREKIDSIDAVLYTHSHSDHLSGLDDLRVFSQKKSFNIYSNVFTVEYIKKHYPYAINKNNFPGLPNLNPIALKAYESVDIEGFKVVPIILEHGKLTHMQVFGYRIDDDFAYLTDTSYIPDRSYECLKGVKVLVIGALRKRPHGAHFSFSEAYAAGKRIGANEIYFTHVNHDTSFVEIDSLYPDASCAYDSLKLTI